MAHALDEDLLRTCSRQVLGALVRRGTAFAEAEDAVQEALLEATLKWPEAGVPDEPVAWLTTVARRKLVDAQRSDIARRRRENHTALEPEPGPTEQSDDTLLLLFLCCHPELSATAAVPLTLRAVGGLTTREIAEAYLLPEATISQRISRAKKTIADVDLSVAHPAIGGSATDKSQRLRRVLEVLYLIFNEGYTTGDRVDLAAEAIRLTRLLYAEAPDPEVGGLLALMLLHHARRAARFDNGRLVPLDEQDRTRWDRAFIAEGVDVLQSALAQDRRGEYQIQAAIAALHDDAATAAETDWPQILEWYDELELRTLNPLVSLSRAVAIGEVDGPLAGLASLNGIEERLSDYHRLHAVRGHLHEQAGNASEAAELFTKAATSATSEAERNHLLKRAAQARERTH